MNIGKKVLEYSDYRNLEKVITKTKEACANSGQDIENHFVDFTEMVEIDPAPIVH